MPSYFLRIERSSDDVLAETPPVTTEMTLQAGALEAAQDEATLLLGENGSPPTDGTEWGRGVGAIAKIVDGEGSVLSTRPVEAFNDSWVPTPKG